MRWRRPDWTRESIRSDLAAGLTTAVVLIPQGMGYAMLAGLPPICGLYSAMLPLIGYALLGTSRQLAVGPVAMDSLLEAAGVGAIAEIGSEAFIAYAILLAGMVGLIQLAMGLGRFGFLVNFLSRPVISGFTSAAALIIGSSQLQHILGVEIPRSPRIHETLLALLSASANTHLWTFAIGAGGVIALFALKAMAPRVPRALLVVSVATVLVSSLQLDANGVAIVGAVPPGLPEIVFPTAKLSVVVDLVPVALTVALVAFLEAIAVAKTYAIENGDRLDTNRELIALGAANVLGAVSQAYPVTGGFSRTAVNAQAGAKTKLAGVITASVVVVTLMLLTPLFFYMPKAVLSSIIIVAVVGLVDVREVARLWRVNRNDLLMLVMTFTATLGVGIQFGILAGVVLSVLSFVYYASKPHIAVLGRLPGTSIYRNVNRFPDAERLPGVLIVRIDSDLFFGNVAFVEDALRSLEALEPNPIHTVILDGSGINSIDATAESTLRQLAIDYQRRDVRLVLVELKSPVRDALERSHYYELIGRDHVFRSLDEATDGKNLHAREKSPTEVPVFTKDESAGTSGMNQTEARS